MDIQLKSGCPVVFPLKNSNDDLSCKNMQKSGCRKDGDFQVDRIVNMFFRMGDVVGRGEKSFCWSGRIDFGHVQYKTIPCSTVQKLAP